MSHYQHEPPPLLRDYIKCLWASERHFQPPHQSFEILPDSYIELVFTFGAPCFIVSGTARYALPRCAVIGLLDQPLQLLADGVVQVIGARFYAWGFAPLFNDALQLPNAFNSVDAPWQALATRMEQVISGGELRLAVELLESYLVVQVESIPAGRESIPTAARKLLEQTGSLSSEGLATASHYSRRQIERKFGQSAGVSPKALAQKLRFEQVRDQLAADPLAVLATLAHDCGYADQAHLAREFKRYSGKTPRAFARDMVSLRGWMREALNVVFLGDDTGSL